MYLRSRAASVALALTAALSVACTDADMGNNTLADDPKTPAPSTPAAGPQTTAPAEAGEDIQLEAKDNVFAPLTITAPAGDITIVMKNTGLAPHTFTNADLGVDVNANAGQTANVEIKGAKPGKYHFICKYHESLKMVGDLTVT